MTRNTTLFEFIKEFGTAFFLGSIVAATPLVMLSKSDVENLENKVHQVQKQHQVTNSQKDQKNRAIADSGYAIRDVTGEEVYNCAEWLVYKELGYARVEDGVMSKDLIEIPNRGQLAQRKLGEIDYDNDGIIDRDELAGAWVRASREE
jgi:hypothetical protein